MNRIRELRKEKRLTQEELAKEIGVSQISISHWETGKYEIGNANLMLLANYFGVTVDYLLGGEEPLVNNDPALTKYLDELKTRPEMRMLFSLASSATKEDVEKAVRIIEAFLKD